MKRHLQLIQSLLADAGRWCSVSTTRDFERISRRVEHEGFSFLAITLPGFCKDFERSLDLGRVCPTLFTSFKRRGALPLLLGGLLDLVFNRADGLLLDNADPTAVFYIRQVTLLYKKTLQPCTKVRERNAFDAYIECEKELREAQGSGEPDYGSFDLAAHMLWYNVLRRVDSDILRRTIVPKHGPGATADKVVGNAKFAVKHWHSRLEEWFPSADFLIPNYGFNECLESVEFLEPENEIYPRVVSVPKTLKTPRIISIEPVCMQYAQQSLLEYLVDKLERDDFLDGCVGFTDQTPNQRMAQIGSANGSLATIDLSEASDRVSNSLVLRLFRQQPVLSAALQACRSTHANVPGYGVIPLTKFASMGSATTFPVEAMVFLTITVSAWIKSLNKSPTRKALKTFLKRVRVYGDDIVVPTDLAGAVVSELSHFNMKVNTTKSFWTGRFRESCGRDYYAGNDVTVTYMRREFPQRWRNASEMVSLVETRNQFFKAGCWATAKYLDEQIGKLATYPIVEETSPIIGRNSFLPYGVERVCEHLHRPLVKGLMLRVTQRPSPLEGYGALMKFFLKRGRDPIFDAKHLERYGRPLSVDTKIGWAPPY